jgi:hypothetical protein
MEAFDLNQCINAKSPFMMKLRLTCNNQVYRLPLEPVSPVKKGIVSDFLPANGRTGSGLNQCQRF